MKHGIIIIHGMGQQSSGYSYGFQRKLQKYWRRSGNCIDDLVFKEICWSPLIEHQEAKMINRMNVDLRYFELRRFIIQSFGDVIAYQKTGVNSDFYSKVHCIILKKYFQIRSDLKKLINDNENFKISFVAHSLGVSMVSNFLYDYRYQWCCNNRLDFHRIFSFGSTLPLWVLRNIKMDQPLPLYGQKKWINMYADTDVLGYPLGTISDEYTKLVDKGFLKDIKVNPGSIFTSWNPLCHNYYWTSDDVIRVIANEL